MRTEDERIIYKCLNGESEAFGFLVDKYKESVYAFAFSKLRNFHDAEDVTQEVFIKAYKKLHTLRRWDDFLAWLYAITYNLCKNWIRANSRRPDHRFIEDEDPRIMENHSMDSYRETIASDLLQESIQEALDSLPEIYQQVLVLHYLGNMNSFEIARFLGMAPGSIRERLSRARTMLKEEMLTMISATFEMKKLRVGFTFRIVEAIKRIRVQPVSPKALPWGMSLATGIIITFLTLGQHFNIIDPVGMMKGSPLPSMTRVLKVGEIPVDVIKVSNAPIISSQRWNGNGLGNVLPNLQNAIFMAPQGQGDTWTKKADMPTPRGYLSSSVVNGKIYVIGGYTGKDMLSTVEEYDPVKDTWARKSDMPTARCDLTTSVVNGKIYAIGGYSVDGPVTTIEEYDPTKDKWTWKANMLGNRKGLSSSVVNGKIYIIGGIFLNNPLSTVEEYDPVEDKLISKTNMPTPRGWLSTNVVDGKIYALGGQGPDAALDMLSTVEEYDPMIDKWTKKADMPIDIFEISTSVGNGKIYAICNGPEMYEYDSLINTWTRKADMPTARGALTTSVVNGKIYAIGGVLVGNWPNPISIVEEYDTGFGGEGVNFKGKLPTTWGDVKFARNK